MSNKSCVLVNERQKPNRGVISEIRNVPIEYVPTAANMFPDFMPNPTTAMVFLSFKYNFLHPAFIAKRLSTCPRPSVFKLKIVLLLVDMDIPTTPVDASMRADSSNPAMAFVELNNICFRNDFTLLCAFSELECARYIETFKSYEAKSMASIQEKQEVDFLSQVTKFLTSNIPGLNKTDVVTLLETYGDLATLSRQSEHDLLLIPGIGDTKAKRIHKLFNTPFSGAGVGKKSLSAGGTGTTV